MRADQFFAFDATIGSLPVHLCKEPSNFLQGFRWKANVAVEKVNDRSDLAWVSRNYLILWLLRAVERYLNPICDRDVVIDPNDMIQRHRPRATVGQEFLSCSAQNFSSPRFLFERKKFATCVRISWLENQSGENQEQVKGRGPLERREMRKYTKDRLFDGKETEIWEPTHSSCL